MRWKGPTAAHPICHAKAQFIQKAHRQLAAVPGLRDVDVVSATLPVAGAVADADVDAVAADALISAVLFGCLPASTLPRSRAPSSIARRSVCTSPVTWPVLHSCTLSRPVTFPSIFPRTITSRASTSAFTCPFGPMVRQLFVVRLSFPSTTPSTKRSSLPMTSPLILIPWLMHAAARDGIGSATDTEGALVRAVLGEVAEFAGAAVLPEIPSGFGSSFFHIRHLDIENRIFEAAHRRAGWNCDSE